MMTGNPEAMIERLLALSPDTRLQALRSLSRPQRRELLTRWAFWAHANQREPAGDWTVWLIRAGRGFGKTRAGAEWITGLARDGGDLRIALVGASREEVARVMIEGASGLLAVAREDERPVWRRDAGELRFPSGATAFAYSAERPDALRGPEHEIAWCDELAKWRQGDATWDNLMMGLRRGERPRVLVTTTPRPTPLVRRVEALAAAHDAVTLGRTRDNPHLPDSFVAAMLASYSSTRLGRQELDGELIDDVAGALWTRAAIEGCRVAAAPSLVRVVVAVDPPASATGDACGIVAAGLGRDGHGYVLEDASVGGLSPGGWAMAVAACAARHRADRVIAEKNNGGEMVLATLRHADPGLPLAPVHATSGKAARAEPIALLYEAGRVHHVGALPVLEDELCGLVAGGGYVGPSRSPDRADACVWALTALMRPRAGAAVRVFG